MLMVGAQAVEGLSIGRRRADANAGAFSHGRGADSKPPPPALLWQAVKGGSTCPSGWDAEAPARELLGLSASAAPPSLASLAGWLPGWQDSTWWTVVVPIGTAIEGSQLNWG